MPTVCSSRSDFGRAHHRVLHFVNRQPGLTIAELLDILRITKQSLSRVLKELLDEGYVEVALRGERSPATAALSNGQGAALGARSRTAAIGARSPGARRFAGRARERAVEFLLAMIDPGERDKVQTLVSRDDGAARQRLDTMTDATSSAGRGHARRRCGPSPPRRRRPPYPCLDVRYLTQRGYRVTTAVDANDARVRLKSLSFDLIVLDVMMPGENGFEFATALRRESQVPILMLTAHSEARDRVRGFEAGADDYLVKPFEPQELSLRIASILRRSAPRGAAPSRMAVCFGNFIFHIERGELHEGEEVVRLTERERFMLQPSRPTAPARLFAAKRLPATPVPATNARSTCRSIGCAARSSATPPIHNFCKRCAAPAIG